MNDIKDLVKQLIAIETLEYLDKNHLSGDNESRSRKKIELLKLVLHRLEETK